MKIKFDRVSSEYQYPLSKREVRTVTGLIPEDIRERIMQIRFGCNTKTIQEARIVGRGVHYDIRINFCLYDFRSPLLSDKTNYIKIIEMFGGKVDFNTRHILWGAHGSKRYACFLIFHEVGHVLYTRQHCAGILAGKNSSKEEDWCDRYAIRIARNIKI